MIGNRCCNAALLIFGMLYLFQRDGVWMGKVQDKLVFLDQLENDRAIIQVYPDWFGATPILSIEYDVSKLYPWTHCFLCWNHYIHDTVCRCSCIRQSHLVSFVTTCNLNRICLYNLVISDTTVRRQTPVTCSYVQTIRIITGTVHGWTYSIGRLLRLSDVRRRPPFSNIFFSQNR